MDVSTVVDREFHTVDASARVGELRGTFLEPRRRAVPVTDNGSFLGIVTRRDVLSSHELPSRKVRSLTRSVPIIQEDVDVREAARLMLTADTWTLPVVNDDTVVGVVRADDLLAHVRESLRTLEARDLMTDELVTVPEETTLGRTLALFREHGIRHLPIEDELEGHVVGIVSLHDVLGFVTRQVHRSQGGDPAESIEAAVGRPHGGFGAREGERRDLLALPVRNVSVEPVESVGPDARGDEILAAMLAGESSSVLVHDEAGTLGIVTKTDLLESLTWTDDQPYYIHVFGADRMSETTWEYLSDRIASVARKDRSLRLIEAKVHFHHHKEQVRGRPLVLARVRFFTDRGMFVGNAEGYGDRHAFSLAVDVIERQLLDAKLQHRPDQSMAELVRYAGNPEGSPDWENFDTDGGG